MARPSAPISGLGADFRHDRGDGRRGGALEEQHAELAGLLEGLDDDGWAAPSRCEGWTVADVVLHLAQTDEMALASAEGRLAGTSPPRPRA